MKTVVIIPARFASSRLPGKPLIEICGKSLLLRTFEQCVKAFPRESIFIATDDERIAAHCKAFDMNFVMTSSACLTGTDRVAEAARQIDADVYINVQGDEPLINPKDIIDTIRAAEKYPESVLNGFASIKSEEQYRSRTIPKVVFREDGRLLYMSRSPIPGTKEDIFKYSWRQICVYAFPKKSLEEFSSRDKKSPLEESEDIEILRFLEMGYDVRMIELSNDSIAVDTSDDVKKVEKYLLKNG